MTEKWTGFYVYGETYSEDIRGVVVPFEAEWTNNDGAITGTCTDDETKHVFIHPSTIDGFIEGEMISFIKRYPCRWSIDADGKITVEPRKAAIDVHYSGTWVGDHFEGEWDMTVTYLNQHGFPKEYECTGTWVLCRTGEEAESILSGMINF